MLLGKDRMLILRQGALGVLRQLLSDQVGSALSPAILTQFGARCGSEDHKTLKAAYQWSSETEEMAAGPVLHTWEGIVKATPTCLEKRNHGLAVGNGYSVRERISRGPPASPRIETESARW